MWTRRLLQRTETALRLQRSVAMQPCRVEPPPELLTPLRVPDKILLGPGPSNCSPRVLHALSLPVVGHLHPECTQVMDEVKAGLRYVFQTRNAATLAVSATGHGGMEMALCNLVEPGDVVLVVVGGLWGQRAADMARRYGADVRLCEKLPGQNFSLQELEAEVARHRPAVVFAIQGDSSTGVYQPLQGAGQMCHRYDSLLVVDTVASLCGVPFLMDEWEIDVVYSGSQKVLGTPPGLAPISFSPRAVAKVESRKSPPSVFYWDLKLLGNYWACFDEPRKYHHTASSNLLCALREGLAQVAEEGLQACVERHGRCSAQLWEGLARLWLQPFAEGSAARLPTVNAVRLPEDVDFRAMQEHAASNYSMEIAAGLGPTAGKAFRVGLMGYNATPGRVALVLRVIEEGLELARSAQMPSRL
ncbi:alanine--glyoxylate aminotransferase [Bacillus rossius redtenbacheri]|uniref:alanine--glyoxylate aminotransferase n=1 Tax=Bacillus rossius redtenbacheri TaxID=93214 RepID=UPI002FDF0161